MLPVSVVLEAASGAWSEAENGIRSMYSGMAALLRTVMGIGALVVLVLIVLRLFKGEREAASSLAWWFFGLLFGFVALSVLSSL